MLSFLRNQLIFDKVLIKVISFEIVTEYKYQVTRYFTHVEILNKIMLLEGDLTEIVTDYKHCDLATCNVVMLCKMQLLPYPHFGQLC